MKQSYDFTAGPIGRPLLLYTLPLLLANVLQSFYQLVDLLVVGRIVGETGLAAISSASTVCFLITSLGTGLTTGGMVRVAQQAGAKDTTGLEETAGTLFSASLVVSLLVAVAGALTAPCLLQLLSVPSEAMTDASAYKGAYFVNANSTTAPQIVDRSVQPILDRAEVYSGCYARVSINFYAFNSNGNRSIACGLGNIQKVRDGEPLGGRSSAADDFSTDFDDDFLS